MNKPACPTSLISAKTARRADLDRHRARSRGVTLIELLVAICALGLLATMAVPAMSAITNSIQLASATNSLFSHMTFARGEAIKRNSRVVLCKSADGTSCAASGGWEQGWIVFHDANNNGARDNTETIIQREVSLNATLRLTGNLNVAQYVSFASTGATRLVGGGFQAGTLTVCHYSIGATEARWIVLNAVGRPRIQKANVSSCP